MNRNIKIVFTVFCIWFSIIGVQLWRMQIVNYEEYKERARRNRTRKVAIVPSRGDIYDRTGVLLADSRAATQLVVLAKEIEDEKKLIDFLVEVIGIKEDIVKKTIRESLYKPFIPAVLAQDLGEEILIEIAESKPHFPGIDIQISPVRDYLYGKVCAPISGYVGEITRKELSLGYKWGDIIGRVGVEKVWDDILRGKAGVKLVQVDQKGNIDKVLDVVEPLQGDNLYTTIDFTLQKIAYDALGERAGAVVVLNPKNGDILVCVSSPSYDPNMFVSPVQTEFVSKIFNDKETPMLNRAIAGLYPPGSVFKVIVAIAALESGVVSSKNIFHCDGVFQFGDTTFRCWGKHGWVNLENALKKSCNEYFYQIGLKAGAEKISEVARRFGLGEVTGVNIRGEKKGLIPFGSGSEKKWFRGDTVNLSIGHGYILVTPMQIACMISTIANNGYYCKPRFVLKKVSFTGEEELLDSSSKIKIEVKEEYLKSIRKGLFKVVNEPGGTAYRTHVEGLDVAGKTGTVELKERGIIRNICWFTGFAPFENPEIVVAVVVEKGEGGGVTAGPIAKRIFEEIQKRRKVE